MAHARYNKIICISSAMAVASAALAILLYIWLESDDLKTEVIVFPNAENWYYIIYDDLGKSALDHHLDINFLIDNDNIFWAYGASLDNGWRQSLFYVSDGNGGLRSISETPMFIHRAGNTSRNINGKSYTIRFMYLGERAPDSDYQIDSSQIILKIPNN